MADLEDILSIALGAGKQQIQADDPYLGLATTANDIGSIFTKSAASPELMSRKNATRDAILGAAISGLFGGAMTGLSSDYQTDRMGKYNNLLTQAMAGRDVTSSDDVTRALARTAQNQAEQSRFLNAGRIADDDRLLKNQIALNAANQLAQSPKMAQSILGKLLGINIAEPTPIAVSAEGNRGIEGAMLDEIAVETQRLIDAGVPPTQAATTARYAYDARKKELQDSYARVSEAEKSGQAMLRMVDNLESAVQGAGDTGILGGLRNRGANFLGELGFEGQAQKAASGKELESLGAEIVRSARQIGSGPMSDRDVQMYLQSGPSLTNPEETNQAIIDRMRVAGALQTKYADFMREQRKLGVPVNEAEQAWSGIVKENPYFLRDSKTGSLAVNPAWEKAFSTSPTKPTQGNIVTAPDGKKILIVD